MNSLEMCDEYVVYRFDIENRLLIEFLSPYPNSRKPKVFMTHKIARVNGMLR